MIKTVTLKGPQCLKNTAWPILKYLEPYIITFADEEPDHNLQSDHNSSFSDQG